ncbi:hypothetical protein CDL12_18960 [Handroanthus impetiginosus]|uniref:Uncharacterized protein n=1 Tax=Handroanthus impetiginosus TaxID=429701 RepID=A0A2G9GT58_9LAMI|nr:hypothetical protein CDL12_18960 [Handroanthus impetiginosus]
MLLVIRGRGGGLTLASTGNETCPLSVVQEQLEVKNGLPLTFRPLNSKNGVVRVSTDQNIKFSVGSICVQSIVWKLDSHYELTGQYFITTGGLEGNPVICKDVGIFLQDGKSRLALTDDAPFRVMFMKA